MGRISLGTPSGRQGLMDDAGWDFIENEVDCADCKWAYCTRNKDGECDFDCSLLSCEFEEGKPIEDDN